MSPVSGTARMNIAALSDEDLALLRGTIARALDEDAGADPFDVLGALHEETELRSKEPT